MVVQREFMPIAGIVPKNHMPLRPAGVIDGKNLIQQLLCQRLLDFYRKHMCGTDLVLIDLDLRLFRFYPEFGNQLIVPGPVAT